MTLPTNTHLLPDYLSVTTSKSTDKPASRPHETPSDDDIIRAAFSAFKANSCNPITTNDVYEELGIHRNSRQWDNRNNIVSHQRIRYLLRSAGFTSIIHQENGGKKGRYVLHPPHIVSGGITCC